MTQELHFNQTSPHTPAENTNNNEEPSKSPSPAYFVRQNTKNET